MLLPALGGLAALSWEVLWQLRTALAFGVSASGAAVTLATMMAGMTIGALLAGRYLPRSRRSALQVYGVFELCIGVCGILSGPAFSWLEKLDVSVWQSEPTIAPLVRFVGVVLVILPAAVCMGASIPVFGYLGRQLDLSVAWLYGLNTAGAALGTLVVAFYLIPAFGLDGTTRITAGINLTVGVIALSPLFERVVVSNTDSEGSEPDRLTLLIVFCTGFVTFLLEVAWFRAMRAAFETTTSGFAIMLAVVLVSLGLAARFASLCRKRKWGLDRFVFYAGVAILVSTPFVERLDTFLVVSSSPLVWFGYSFLLVGPSVFFLGLALPWFLESDYSASGFGRVYAVNTVGAVLGALSAAWIFLPTLGFVKTAWLAGVLMLLLAFVAFKSLRRIPAFLLAVLALACCVTQDSGVGRDRVLMSLNYGAGGNHKLLDYSEGVDASTSVIELDGVGRALFIDGFAAAALWPTAHYMEWMGSLPVLLNASPEHALVICFGTGQTLNAIRNEDVSYMRIVDINPAVFEFAEYFSEKNESVLRDKRVHRTLMDGRAYLRRTEEKFDVITLEPMPPNHAGVNALYSREFYELARRRLSEGGTIAQWLPAHLVSDEHARSIAKTFQEVFPNSALWVDPSDTNGILVGSKEASPEIGSQWPGLSEKVARSLDDDGVKTSLMLSPAELAKFAMPGTVVTDDNQHLAYGDRFSLKSGTRSIDEVRESFEEHRKF